MKKATLDQYMDIGAQVKLIKAMMSNLMTMTAGTLPKTVYGNEFRSLERAMRNLSSKFEDRMFREYPELPDDYLKVFWGNMPRSTGDEMERDLAARMEKIIDGLIE